MKSLLSLFLLSPALAQVAPAKSEPPRNDDSCAKTALAAIYSAEKSYYSEYAAYADTDNAIGFAPEPGECPDWDHSIRISGNGQEFLAEMRHHKTGATWTVDETKKMVKERE